MTKDTLLALAERVEAATGPDRRLDYRIYSVAVGRPIVWDPEDDRYRYTASLDAAMTLVPDGARAVLDNDGCHTRITHDDWPWNGYAGFAGTMPLATIAAALRAHAATPIKDHL